MDKSKALLIDACMTMYNDCKVWADLPYHVKQAIEKAIDALDEEEIRDYFCPNCKMPPHNCLCGHEDL